MQTCSSFARPLHALVALAEALIRRYSTDNVTCVLVLLATVP